MNTELEVGAVLEGKVSGITKFGAFISLPGGKSGLVHISEIAYTYVNDVNDLLSEGQDVKVKIISIDESGRINLSIKKAIAPPPRSAQAPRTAGERKGFSGTERKNAPDGTACAPSRPSAPRAPRPEPQQSKEPQSFDDMLKRFMSDSDSKLSGRYSDKPRSRRGNNRKS